MNFAAVVRESGVSPRLVVAAAAFAACHLALAQQADVVVVAAADTAPLAAFAHGDSMPRVEVTRNALPRVEGLDSATNGQRLDVTVAPQRKPLGLALGMSGFQPQQPFAPTAQPAPGANLDVGLTYRHTTENNYQVDFTAWRRVSPMPDALTLIQQKQQSTYLARVELNLGAGKIGSGFAVDRGFVGLQLEDGARIALKRRNGGAMIYYGKKF